jgi:hypothetical protein
MSVQLQESVLIKRFEEWSIENHIYLSFGSLKSIAKNLKISS